VTRGPTLPADDTLDLVDSNPVVFCDLLPRHPVARQGADATVLGSGYLAGLMPDCRPSPYLLLIGRCFDLRCTCRHLRLDCEDTRLAPRLLLSRRCGVRSGYWRVPTYGLLPRLKEVFRVLASSVDPLTIITSVRRLPLDWQELPQRKLLTGKRDMRIGREMRKGVQNSLLWERFRAEQIAAFGRIDVLHNNVGTVEVSGAVVTSEESWDRVNDVNLKSMFLTCKHVLPHMERQGKGAIANIASVSGIRWLGVPYISYAATKAAVIQFTRVIPSQYARSGIRATRGTSRTRLCSLRR